MTGSDPTHVNVFFDFWVSELKSLGKLESITYSQKPAPCLLVATRRGSGIASKLLATKVSDVPLKHLGGAKIVAKHCFYHLKRHRQLYLLWLDRNLSIKPSCLKDGSFRLLPLGFGLRLSNKWREEPYPKPPKYTDSLGKDGFARMSRILHEDLKINFPFISKIVVDEAKGNLQISFVATNRRKLALSMDLVLQCIKRAGFHLNPSGHFKIKTYHVHASQSREGVKHVKRVRHVILHVKLMPRQGGVRSIVWFDLPPRRGFELLG